jgi:hypothetical protein
MQRYDFEIIIKKGEKNVVGDALKKKTLRLGRRSSMDFITSRSLTDVQSLWECWFANRAKDSQSRRLTKNVIMKARLVVDLVTKYAHFCSLFHLLK